MPILLMVAVAALVTARHGLLPAPWASGAGSSPAVPAAGGQADGHVTIGVTTAELARNWWQPWDRSDLRGVADFERNAAKRAGIVMWYADWGHSMPSTAQLTAIAVRGSTPQITWEPWDASKGLYSPQPEYRLKNIIDGKFDTYIGVWARALAAWRKPVLLRFAQEMDGNWYPWDDHANGNRPGDFARAWRHVHDIFVRAGASNVRWVWSPAFAIAREQFPGAGYVDVLGTTCINAGGRDWRSFERICGAAVARLHALAPALPIQLSEVASAEAGGSKSAWIEGMFNFLRRHREVRSLIWFNMVKGPDWRIDSSHAAKSAFAETLR